MSTKVKDPKYAGRSEGTPKKVRRNPKPGEVIPLATFQNLTWPLADDLANEAAPGRVVQIRITVRFEDVAVYADGRRTWITSVLGVDELTAYSDASRPSISNTWRTSTSPDAPYSPG